MLMKSSGILEAMLAEYCSPSTLTAGLKRARRYFYHIFQTRESRRTIEAGKTYSVCTMSIGHQQLTRVCLYGAAFPNIAGKI